MSRSQVVKPPAGLSPEEYVKWRHRMMQKYGQNIFSRFGIDLPEEYSDLSGFQQQAYDEQVDELIYNLTEQNRSRDEDALAEGDFDFVDEEQWKLITSGKVKGEDVFFKLFQGRNYELEFVRSPPDILLHIMLPFVTVSQRRDVYQNLIDMMHPIVPPYWDVFLSFAGTVTPFYCKDMQSPKTVSSYCVKFQDACELPGAPAIINSIVNKFLEEFVLPQHMA